MRKLFHTIAGILAFALSVITAATTAPALRAQAQSDLRFEVASIRRVETQATANGGVPVFPTTGGIGTTNPTRITYRAAWLRNLITEAFGVRPDQITGPVWLTQMPDRFDIVANIPEGATKEQFKAMLVNLLRDRFHMRFHFDSKTGPVYALRRAKSGPKFKETLARTPDPGTTASVASGPDAQGFLVVPPDFHGMMSRPTLGELFTTAQDVTMADLARSIESSTGRPVVDETGLTGRYDFRIQFEWPPRRGGPALVPEPAPSIFSAVEEQLGLKLEPSTSAFPHLIIDSMDREPTEN